VRTTLRPSNAISASIGHSSGEAVRRPIIVGSRWQ
jgi:hypothetical protein